MPARLPRTRLLAVLAPLALAAACAADDDDDAWTKPDEEVPDVRVKPTGGPLANAGPDRQILEGQVVSLEAGASLPGEAGRDLRYLWMVEPGAAVPLGIDDPTARRIRVVAPVLEDGVDRVDVRLRLRVDDGVERAEDVVRLEVVRGPAAAVAPVASAGPDLTVVAGDAVTVGPRPGDDAILDPACPDEGCPAPVVTWTLVDGRGAELLPIAAPTAECQAPCARVETSASLAEGILPERYGVVEILTYRVDVVSGTTGLAAAPDFVRVFVKKDRSWLEEVPAVTLDEPAPWYVGIGSVQVYGDSDEPLGFRPVLGDAAPPPDDQPRNRLRHDAPAEPALFGWVFEGRNDRGQVESGRLHSAPRFLLADWRGLGAPQADAGPDPVHLVDGASVRPDGCDRVRLVGAGLLVTADHSQAAACAHGRSHPDLEFCWVQTHGPATLDGVPAGCGPRQDGFESGSLLAGCDSDLACPELVVPPPVGDAGRVLAYQLKVRWRARRDQPASAWSVPDTAAIHVVAGTRDDPPSARIAMSRLLGDGSLVPLAGPIGEGETVVVDASGSVDPEGQALAFSVAGDGNSPLAFAPHEPCPVPGACFAARAPTVVAPTSFPLVIAVLAGGSGTVCGSTGGICLDRQGNPIDLPALAVDDSINEPPVLVVATERTVAPGETVRLDASETQDPNGDPLVFAWTVLGGNVTLVGADTATPTFVAPAVAAEAILEVRVGDDRGGEARATVRIHVVPPA